VSCYSLIVKEMQTSNQDYAMQKTSRKKLTVTSAKRRIVEADFEGGAVTSDARLLLVRETDCKLGLIRAISKRMADRRQEGKVEHSVETMLRQRVMGLCAGWEDLNDSAQSREDPLHQIVAGSDNLASAPTHKPCSLRNSQGVVGCLTKRKRAFVL
jgi:hypothetical protein